MAQNKHTPAPWAFKRNKFGNRLVEKNGKSVQYFNPDHPDGILTAAAPEMYDLLHVILMQHKTGGAYSSKGEVVLSKTMENHIEHLLIKARGE